ncbi:MAG TPA: hypothetical protein VKR52_02250 [Terracidiphilus sp.]|nr:hypothetical protein [Terracidiphilus sp.]
MFNVGQEVTVISDKGVGYTGYILACATGDDGQKAYKIAMDGAGMGQLGQWHKSTDVFVIDAQETSAQSEETISIDDLRRR